MATRLETASRNRLSARDVLTAKMGVHADGGGLLLCITQGTASWVFRFTSPAGKRREMGLGRCERGNVRAAGDSLAQARKSANDARAMLAELPPRDPIDVREKAREAAREAQQQRMREKETSSATLARIARAYHERVIEPRRARKYAADWISSLERHVPAQVWHKPVATVTRAELLDLLSNLQANMADTAHRVRRRLEEVLDDAIERELIEVNPVTMLRGKLRRMAVPKRVEPRPAMAFTEVPSFVMTLRARPSIAALCLEFTILTASRTAETIGATWPEFDLEAAMWTIGPSRMKASEEHRVHLSSRALQILDEMREIGSRYVFPSPGELDRSLSNMSMLALLKRLERNDITVHGFRASFSTWANETGAARPDVIEACLAHREGDRIRRAYNRSRFTADRRALLDAWAAFIEAKREPANVVPIKRPIEVTTAA
jgi:integrase